MLVPRRLLPIVIAQFFARRFAGRLAGRRQTTTRAQGAGLRTREHKQHWNTGTQEPSVSARSSRPSSRATGLRRHVALHRHACPCRVWPFCGRSSSRNSVLPGVVHDSNLAPQWQARHAASSPVVAVCVLVSTSATGLVLICHSLLQEKEFRLAGIYLAPLLVALLSLSSFFISLLFLSALVTSLPVRDPLYPRQPSPWK